ncbi:MAG: SRPBCC family protein [Myxococcota bacterium]
MSGESQDEIVKVVDLAAPIDRVWQALTDHQEFGEWFRVRLDGPFEVGRTTTGQVTYPGFEHMEWVSVTERMEHERVFAFSWPPSTVDPEHGYDDDAKVLVEFRLEAIPAGIRLTITESGLSQFPEPKRLEILRSNREGWELQAKNIEAYLAR